MLTKGTCFCHVLQKIYSALRAQRSSLRGPRVVEVEIEQADILHQPVDLLVERAPTAAQRGVLLRGGVHMRHRQIDLFNAGALFSAGRGDIFHQRGQRLDAGADLLDRDAGAFHQRIAMSDRANGAIGQRADLARRCHCEAMSVFASACRFYRRVERQNIGLKGDAVDHADNLIDFARELVDFIHRRHHFLHHFATLSGALARWRASRAMSLAFCTLPALFFTMEVSYSIEAAICSSALACTSLREESSRLPCATCSVVYAIASSPAIAPAPMRVRLRFISGSGRHQLRCFVTSSHLDMGAQIAQHHGFGDVDRLLQRTCNALDQPQPHQRARQ